MHPCRKVLTSFQKKYPSMFRYVATPVASMLGVKETVRRHVTHNLILESYYCNTTKNPPQVCTLLTALIHDSQTAPLFHKFINCCCYPEFSRETLQADGMDRATGPALVQAAQESGQTQPSQEVLWGQVQTPTHRSSHALSIVLYHVQWDEL